MQTTRPDINKITFKQIRDMLIITKSQDKFIIGTRQDIMTLGERQDMFVFIITKKCNIPLEIGTIILFIH